MNDFKSFYEKGKRDGAGNGAIGGTGVNGGNCGTADTYCGNGGNGAETKQSAELIAMIAKAFGGKSDAQVWRAILAQAEEGKRNGTLTNAEIDNFYATVAPMLDGFKRKKLKEIIERLKAI